MGLPTNMPSVFFDDDNPNDDEYSFAEIVEDENSWEFEDIEEYDDLDDVNDVEIIDIDDDENNHAIEDNTDDRERNNSQDEHETEQDLDTPTPEPEPKAPSFFSRVTQWVKNKLNETVDKISEEWSKDEPVKQETKDEIDTQELADKEKEDSSSSSLVKVLILVVFVLGGLYGFFWFTAPSAPPNIEGADSMLGYASVESYNPSSGTVTMSVENQGEVSIEDVTVKAVVSTYNPTLGSPSSFFTLSTPQECEAVVDFVDVDSIQQVDIPCTFNEGLFFFVRGGFSE